MTQTYRQVIGKTQGIPASDGAGVRLTRIIGSPQVDYLDPFLMLDYFESTNPSLTYWLAKCVIKTTKAMKG